jgi:predicted Zn-dependent protease
MAGSRVTRRTGIGIAAAIAALVIASLFLHSWWQRREFHVARAEIERGEFMSALGRLESLAAWRPPWTRADGGALDYWLGHCRWRAGRRQAAMEAFLRVPEGQKYGSLAAVMTARSLLDQGRWRAAEEKLEHTLGGGGPGLDDVRDQLDQLYRMQARQADAARLLREGCETARDPVRVLRALWRTDRGTPPFATISQALDIGGRHDPSDDRVWLGRARLATQTGRLDEAETWLKRCTERDADPPVWRGWLDWAATADRPDAALRALRALGRDRLDPAERLAWRAWFTQHAGDAAAERRALEGRLALEPHNPTLLARLAALASAAGETERASALGADKAQVDCALEAYGRQLLHGDLDSASDRLTLARLAEAIGRRLDAQVWYALSLKADPENAEARTALARVDSHLPPPAATMLAELDPWEAAVETQASRLAHATNGRSINRDFWFVDDARTAGLSFSYCNGVTQIRQMPAVLGGGVALLDYDGDGWLDVYALQGGPFPPDTAQKDGGDRLFRNQGHGAFEDTTARAGLKLVRGGYSHGVAVGDVNNDGRPDLFLTRWRAYALYINRGNGTFQDVTTAWGLDGDRDWPTSAALADFDGDGDLDLYVCHYVVWDADDPRLCRNEATGAFMSCNPVSCLARPDHIFRNDGTRFVDVTAEAGIVDRDGRGLGVVAADLDDDGRIDLFVANDKSANYLFHNLGGFRFEEVAESAGVSAGAAGGYQAGMGVACGDFDGDGRLDLAVTNYYGESTSLYQNIGSGLFTDRTATSGLARASRLVLGFGAAFLDADNDGWLDLLTANGHTDDLGDAPYEMPAQVLAGLGDGRLTDRTESSGPAIPILRLGRGLAVGDLDNDGRTDALLVSHNQPLAYLHNRTEHTGHWVSFVLEGRRANRDGVGARITVKAGGRQWLAERTGGGSYLSASDPRPHFGLGATARIDDVEVRWPSGQVDRFHGLRVDAVYRVREGELIAERVQSGFAGHDVWRSVQAEKTNH